jgi:hypothetical protein
MNTLSPLRRITYHKSPVARDERPGILPGETLVAILEIDRVRTV